MIVYPIGASGQALELSSAVLDRFHSFRQVRFWQREAGGQLFARIEDSRILVVEATGPRRTDRRSRTSYEPDRRAEQMEIDERFPLKLHFIGDWHTHAEDTPNPSPVDLQSTRDCVRRSRHVLNAFVLIVVGRKDFPKALHVSVHDGSHVYVLEPMAAVSKQRTNQVKSERRA